MACKHGNNPSACPPCFLEELYSPGQRALQQSNSNSCQAFADYVHTHDADRPELPSIFAELESVCPPYERAPVHVLALPSAEKPSARKPAVLSKQKKGYIAEADRPGESLHVKTVKKLRRQKAVLGCKVNEEALKELFTKRNRKV
jgi:hypothetical protein